MATTWEVSTTGGCDSLLIPRTYNDVTTNAKATEYYDNAVLALNTVLEAADIVEGNAEAAATSEANAATSESNAAASEANAATSETNAAASATLAESWAVGGTETRDGEDEDNSKYYAQQASASAEEAESVASETATTVATSVATETTTTLIADFEDRLASVEGATSISVGEYNVAQGHNALGETTTGEYNTALGYDALAENTTGNYNVAVGYQALAANTQAAEESEDDSEDSEDTEETDEEAGNFNTAVGSGALAENTTGKYNVAVGYKAGCEVTDDDGNVLTAAITEGEGNIAIGWECECDGDVDDDGEPVYSAVYPSKHVDVDSGVDGETSTWKKYQISVGFMHGLYFPAGTTQGDMYAAINELVPSLGNTGTYYYGGVGCCGHMGTGMPIAMCNTGTYIRLYYAYCNTSGTWTTASSYFTKGSASTTSNGLKLFFPSKQSNY